MPPAIIEPKSIAAFAAKDTGIATGTKGAIFYEATLDDGEDINFSVGWMFPALQAQAATLPGWAYETRPAPAHLRATSRTESRSSQARSDSSRRYLAATSPSPRYDFVRMTPAAARHTTAPYGVSISSSELRDPPTASRADHLPPANVTESRGSNKSVASAVRTEPALDLAHDPRSSRRGRAQHRPPSSPDP
ncbi:hypothetical protein HBB16_02515 [Pseudonocardia sp. MCCB 268]|nr:hypothetical protein [Pseudonocardia cytotoxica]